MLDKVARIIAGVEIVGLFLHLLAHRLGQGFFNVGFQRQVRADGEPGGQAQRLEHKRILRTCHGHGQLTIRHRERIHRIGMQELRQQPRHLGWLCRKRIHSKERDIELTGQRMRYIQLRHHPQLDQHLPQQIAQLLLRRKGALQVAGRQLAGFNQHFAQSLTLRRGL